MGDGHAAFYYKTDLSANATSSTLKFTASFCPKGAITAVHCCAGQAWVVNVSSFFASASWIFLDLYSFLLVSVCIFLKNTTILYPQRGGCSCTSVVLDTSQVLLV